GGIVNSKLILADSYLKEGIATGTRDGAALKSRELLLEVERTGQKSAYLYELLGYSSEIINDFSRAREYYGKAEDGITIMTPRIVKAKVYAAQGRMNSDPGKSKEYFLKALKFANDDSFKSELYADLSRTEYLLNDLPKAVEYAESAVKKDSSNAFGYLAYAKAVISDKALLLENAKRVEEYLVKAIFLAPRMAEAQYWMGKFDASLEKYDLAIKSYDTAAKLLMEDSVMSVQAKALMMSDVFFDESVVYFIKEDPKYRKFFIEAFNLNPSNVLYRARDNTALKEMMADFVSKTK
ncbi:MAG: hypothetical protein AAB835_01165, partial [Patescibacteria group bacterium]